MAHDFQLRLLTRRREAWYLRHDGNFLLWARCINSFRALTQLEIQDGGI